MPNVTLRLPNALRGTLFMDAAAFEAAVRAYPGRPHAALIDGTAEHFVVGLHDPPIVEGAPETPRVPVALVHRDRAAGRALEPALRDFLAQLEGQITTVLGPDRRRVTPRARGRRS